MSSQPAADQFRRACAQWATGIAIVTATSETGEPHGMTVNSFTSVSLDPPLVLVCIDERATLLPYLNIGAAIAINVLAEDQMDLSSRFARKVEQRFENLDWNTGFSGAPILAGILASFECAVRENHPAGDHRIIVAEATAVNFREGQPLLYFNSNYETL